MEIKSKYKDESKSKIQKDDMIIYENKYEGIKLLKERFKM